MAYTTLKALFTAICDAIRTKDGTTEMISHADIPNRIEAIQTGDGGIDTSDATATPSDMAEGVTAYVKGVKVIGNVSVRDGGQHINTIGYSDIEPVEENLSSGKFIRLIKQLEDGESYLVRNKGFVRLRSPIENFGDATSEDVAQGKTFTSASGLKIIGNVKSAEEGSF